MAIERVDYEYQPSLFAVEDAEITDESVTTVGAEEARLRSMTAQHALEGKEKLPGWYEEYLRLVNGNWPWRVAAYIAWASSPRSGRWPDTQDKLATEVLGLTSDRQITKWRKREAVQAMIVALQVAPMLEHRADVIGALIESAKDPDYKSHQDRKLFLEITGDYVPTSKLIAQMRRSAGEGVAGESDDVLARYADLKSEDEPDGE